MFAESPQKALSAGGAFSLLRNHRVLFPFFAFVSYFMQFCLVVSEIQYTSNPLSCKEGLIWRF
ncbi:MAG TPA: hypothetical protein DD433_04120 [Ruminococcaceae bacterium]|jgi:hypothetical protein|nr:hypothetical protein [Oscillospiraceae bacterium]